MTLDDLEHKKYGFYGFFGDFGLQEHFNSELRWIHYR